jgi:hypothetical protein
MWIIRCCWFATISIEESESVSHLLKLRIIETLEEKGKREKNL